MARELACPLEGCHATIRADTDEEVLDRAAKHAEGAHPDLELDEEMVETLRQGIEDV